MFWWCLFAFILGLYAIIFNKSRARKHSKNYQGPIPKIYGNKQNMEIAERVVSIILGSLFIIFGILGMLDFFPRK